MNRQRVPETSRNTSRSKDKYWLAVFVLLAALVYTPWMAPYGKHSPFILGLPYTLFWWMLLSLLLLLAIVLFVVFVWQEKDEGGGGN